MHVSRKLPVGARGIAAICAGAAGALVVALASVPPAYATDAVVTTSAELVDAITAANVAPGLDTIRVQGTIVLEADLPLITDDLELLGNGQDAVIDGDGRQYGGIVVSSADSFTVSNLELRGFKDETVNSTGVADFHASNLRIFDGGAPGIDLNMSAAGTAHVSGVSIENVIGSGFSLETWADAEVEISQVAITDVTGVGMDVYTREDANATISEVDVSETTFTGISVASYGSSTTAFSSVSVADTWGDGIYVRAVDDAQVEVSQAEIDDTYERGIRIDAQDDSQVSVSRASVTGADDDGINAETGETAFVQLSDVVIADTGHSGIDGEAVENSAIEIDGATISNTADGESGLYFVTSDDAYIKASNFDLFDTAGILADLGDFSGLILERGLVKDSIVGAALAVFGDEDGDVGAYLTDIAVLDSTYEGLILVNVGDAVLDSVTVADNTSSGFGYVTTVGDRDLRVVNSTFSNNGIYGVVIGGTATEAAAQVTFESSTIADNAEEAFVVFGQDNGGPWIPYDGGYELDIMVRNSIVSGSFSDGLATGLAGVLTSEYSLWHGVDEDFATFLATSGPGNLTNVDPLLEPLGDNGGFTPTRLLSEGSPAIDAGDPAAGGYAPELDQRNETRIVGVIDLGATEFGMLADEEDDGDTDGEDADGEDAGGGDADGDAGTDTDAGDVSDTDAGSEVTDDGDQTAGGPSDGDDSEETGTVSGETLPATGAAVSPALIMVGFGVLLLGAVLLSMRSTRPRRR